MGFTFGSNQIDIEIEGKTYKVANTYGLDKKMAEVRQECIKYADAIDRTDAKEESEIFDVFFSFVRETVDGLLGNHVFDQIFEDKELDVYEATDVMMYIVNTIQQYRTNKYGNYSGNTKSKLSVATKPAKSKKKKKRK